MRPTTVGAPALCAAAASPSCDRHRRQHPTSARTSARPSGVQRLTTATGDSLRVSGDIPAGSGQRMFRAMSDPAAGAALLLRKRCANSRQRARRGRRRDGVLPRARTRSPSSRLSLREQLGRMLRFSNNYIADVLT